MSISNYSELKQAVIDWSHKTNISAKLDDFIRLAESRLQLDLDVRQLWATASLSVTAANESVVLPSDFNGARSVWIGSSGDVIVLDPMPLDVMRVKYGQFTAGYPRNYAVRDTDLVIAPIPSGDYTITMDYLAKIACLSDSNPTNNILDNYPDAYLHCCLIFVGQYLRDIELVQGAEALYAADLERINRQNWGQTSPMTQKVG